MSNPYPQQQYPTQQFPPAAYPPPQEPSSGSGCWLYLLIGCLGTLVLSVALCGFGVWWVKNNVGKVVAMGVRTVIVGIIDGSQLDANEKKEVIAQIDRVIDAYKAGKLTDQELQQLFKELEDSPIVALIQIWGMEQAYLEPSGLSAEEKQAGRRTIERFFRGVMEKKLTLQEFQDAMPPSMQNRVQGEKANPNDRPTDDEVKEFLANLKKKADGAEIPDEEFKIDISDELKKDIDKVLAGKE
jgi:chorismate mutase